MFVCMRYICVLGNDTSCTAERCRVGADKILGYPRYDPDSARLRQAELTEAGDLRDALGKLSLGFPLSQSAFLNDQLVTQP